MTFIICLYDGALPMHHNLRVTVWHTYILIWPIFMVLRYNLCAHENSLCFVFRFHDRFNGRCVLRVVLSFSVQKSERDRDREKRNFNQHLTSFMCRIVTTIQLNITSECKNQQNILIRINVTHMKPFPIAHCSYSEYDFYKLKYQLP